MRFARSILWALAGLLVLLLLAGIFVTRLVDADRFRPVIVERLEAATGRRVMLAEGLELAWFPWLALETGAGSIGNPEGMPGNPLVRWEQLRIGARLVPLLRGELVLDRIEARALHLSLERDSSGRANFEGLGPRSRPDAPAAPLRILAFGGVRLRDARVDYVDATRDTRVGVTNMELDVGAWRESDPFDVRAGFDLARAATTDGRPVRVEVRGRIDVEPTLLAPRRLLVEALRLELGLPGEGASRLEVRAQVPSAVVDLEPRRVAVPQLSVRVPAADGELVLRQVAANLRDGAPAVDAQFLLEPRFSLKKLVGALGGQPLRTRDPAALGALGASGRIRYAALPAGEGLRIDPLELSVDGAELVGTVTQAVEPGAALDFALRGDVFDLTRYLEPPDVVSEPFEFPTEALKALRARGVLQIERVRLAELELRGVQLRLELAQGRVAADGVAK